MATATIKLFLVHGDPKRLRTAELSNWTGKAVSGPRTEFEGLLSRDESEKSGIYLLTGDDPETGRPAIYIGEAECIRDRIKHHNDKDFWNQVTFFVSKDENLNKAHIKYLENRLHDIAKSANRYKIDNSIIPTQSSISESDRAEMEEFIEYIKLLVNTLGHKVFDEKREFKAKQKQATFFIKAARGADGQGEQSSDGFVVFKGSKAAATVVNSMSPSFMKLRQKLIDEGVLADKGEYLEFVDDYIFGSPSTAAIMVMGRSANGLTEWKTKDGKTLKEFEANEKTLKI